MRMNPPGSAGLCPDDPLDCLAGIGPKRKLELAELGFHRVADLLFHLPVRFEDRRFVTSLDDLGKAGRQILVQGRPFGISFRHTWKRGFGIVRARIGDENHGLAIVWFNARQTPARLRGNEELLFFGWLRKNAEDGQQLVNPEIIEMNSGGDRPELGIVPIYPRIASLGELFVRRLMAGACAAIPHIRDPLPPDILSREDLPGICDVLRSLHQPGPEDDLDALQQCRSRAHRRLLFDEILDHFLRMEALRRERWKLKAPQIVLNRELKTKLFELLPFDLTSAQTRVLAEILDDLAQSAPMARLLQGDVGSGKTIVAALCMAAVAASGHQAALMAPTEILAEQHARVLRDFFSTTPWMPVLLKGGMKSGERRNCLASIKEGKARIIIGTHALIQEKVVFHSLGLAVVDEQHRFGTLQRRDLILKGAAPHLLVMTATPIPRSLALTLYGDLSISVLDERPPGRLPVRTEVRTEAARRAIFTFISDEVRQGGRVYFVFPLIEASEQVDAPALLESYERIRSEFKDFRTGILHGRMSSEEKDQVQKAFRSGEIQILLCTTVIEVGVDVPEATVIVIEGADRFGLSQLHQLRGRVGRGRRASWCIVMKPSKPAVKTRERLDIFSRTEDGFRLAEEDLRLRGPGELMGTRQWGSGALFRAGNEEEWDLVSQARSLASKLVGEGRGGDVAAALARTYRRSTSAMELRGMPG